VKIKIKTEGSKYYSGHWAQKVWRVGVKATFINRIIFQTPDVLESSGFVVVQILDRRTISSVKITKCGLKILHKKGVN
jgi:hypothetical protein